ncbi:MAG: hypothetical protein F6K42_05205 [Leptolyngbya sp. SIO1D8]|nr:hypothetical protein [Leptolyngbya sp. SIO1D8]
MKKAIARARSLSNQETHDTYQHLPSLIPLLEREERLRLLQTQQSLQLYLFNMTFDSNCDQHLRNTSGIQFSNYDGDRECITEGYRPITLALCAQDEQGVWKPSLQTVEADIKDGLAVHLFPPGKVETYWVITHALTGLRVHAWCRFNHRNEAEACREALLRLGDWSSTRLQITAEQVEDLFPETNAA